LTKIRQGANIKIQLNISVQAIVAATNRDPLPRRSLAKAGERESNPDPSLNGKKRDIPSKSEG
jgi:hypothetical protein